MIGKLDSHKVEFSISAMTFKDFIKQCSVVKVVPKNC